MYAYTEPGFKPRTSFIQLIEDFRDYGNERLAMPTDTSGHLIP